MPQHPSKLIAFSIETFDLHEDLDIMDVEKYHSDSEDRLREDVEPLLSTLSVGQSCRHQRYRAAWIAFYMLSLASTSLFTFLITKACTSHPLGSFHGGYKTDLANARSSLELETRLFTGTPQFLSNGDMVVPEDSPSLPYMGSGPDVDAAWEDLIKDRYFLLTDEEASEVWGEHYIDYWDELRGGYTAGLDVLHTLHCLNYVRMAMYPDIYKFDHLHGETHQQHCMNQLRQVVMCTADLTPIPSIWHDSINQNYIDADQRHTCRDFSMVRDWATERYNGSTAVKSRHRDGSPRAEFYDEKIFASWGEIDTRH